MAKVTIRPSAARVVPHGDGFALMLDPRLLKVMGIDEHTPLSISVEDSALYITHVRPPPTPEQIEATLREINRDWGPVLKKLAE